jgi:hypothetical protein
MSYACRFCLLAGVWIWVQYEQFSRTVGNAAFDQQKEMREAFKAFCNFFSQSAIDANATWPFYSLTNFEVHASTFLKQSGVEVMGIIQCIKDKDAAAALEYVHQNYENWLMQGHLTRYNSLNRLNPVNYHPYFTLATVEGFVNDNVQREQHYANWQVSPRK